MKEKNGEPRIPERIRRLLEEVPDEWKPPPADSPAGRILTAAREIAVRSGLEGISTRAVSEKAGVNQAMIHYYFGSKEKMIGALMRREILGILGDVVAGMDAVSGGEDFLERFPINILETLRADPARLRLVRRVLGTHPERISRAIADLGRHGILGTSRIVLDRIEEEREGGRLSGVQPRSVLLFLLTVVYGLVFLEPVARTIVGFRMEEDADWSDYRDDLRVLVAAGLRGGTAGGNRR